MKVRFNFIVAVLLFAVGLLPGLGQVNDEISCQGITHRGDPPYLLESGWMPLLNGVNMDGWEYVPNTGQGGWTATPGVIWDESDGSARLKEVYISGDRIVNSIEESEKVASDIFTTRKFGDVEIYLEFLVAGRSNSGVYVHGLYEIQIVNSYGKDSLNPTTTCGSVYDFEQKVNDEWVGGVSPLVRAERPAGQWQSYHILFRAPRFDNEGKKISNAKFVRVLQNGVVIHENVERKAPTRASMKIKEAAENPLMLQGNHGTIAYRNIFIRPVSID
ncbi:MAG: DUF1080 domain-containing protein [Bacteroidetes bacterium]|nr:DUF1080 domain-containing protein [Bacteroidota bacterium]